MMEHHFSGRSLRRARNAILLAAVSVLPLCSAERPSADEKPAVLSRLPLAGSGPAELVRQNVGDRRYLYVHRPADQSVTIVDVTAAESPSLVKVLRHGQQNADRGLNVLPDGTVLLTHKGDSKTSEVASSSFLTLVPAQAGSATHSFNNVNGHIVENRRGLLFVTDDKGLSIVRLYESPEEIEAQRWRETLAP